MQKKIPSIYQLFQVQSPVSDLSKVPITAACRVGTHRHPRDTFNPQFFFDYRSLRRILTNINEEKPLWIWGPAGCGKTETIEQIAIRLMRPLFVISFSEDTRINDLLGMTGLDESEKGNSITTYQRGVLNKALTTPDAIVVLDEISMAPPGVVAELNKLLQSREILIRETGESLRMADHVAIVATANTAGTFDESGLYHGSNAQNGATMSRFSGLRIGYLPPEKEIIMLRRRFPNADQELDIVESSKSFTEMAVDLASLLRSLVDQGVVRLPFTVRNLMTFLKRTLDYGKDIREGFADAYYDLLTMQERTAVGEVFKNVYSIEME